MEAHNRRLFGERRDAGPRGGEGRRIDEVRRIRNRRHGGSRGMTHEDEFDRRGVHPWLFAALGFPLLRGIRRVGLARRSGVARRSVLRRWTDEQGL